MLPQNQVHESWNSVDQGHPVHSFQLGMNTM
jgi:hypothetical protein